MRWRALAINLAAAVPLSIKRLHGALQLDQQRIAFSIHFLANWYLDPTFTDAVFLDIGALLAIEANADVVFEYRRNVMGAARVCRETVG